jgi:hypothetical protein
MVRTKSMKFYKDVLGIEVQQKWFPKKNLSKSVSTMVRNRIAIMVYHAMSLVLGIVYPIHVCLHMILYASFFCNGIRETLFPLLHVGQILNE